MYFLHQIGKAGFIESLSLFLPSISSYACRATNNAYTEVRSHKQTSLALRIFMAVD